MPKITESEYEPLKAFFVAWLERFPISFEFSDPGHHPVAVLGRMEKLSMSKARTGLGMAIGDTLEDSWHLSPAELDAIDRDFSDRGILSLSEVRKRYSRKVAGILKRGIIRNESEYYLIAGVLATTTPDAEDEMVMLGNLIVNFENRVAKKQKGG